jgi:hypothetical protein
MSPEQLRRALSDLNGERAATVMFKGVAGEGACLTIQRAMLVPDEPDHLVKVTDGQSIFILDAEAVAWLRIGLQIQ